MDVKSLQIEVGLQQTLQTTLVDVSFVVCDLIQVILLRLDEVFDIVWLVALRDRSLHELVLQGPVSLVKPRIKIKHIQDTLVQGFEFFEFLGLL